MALTMLETSSKASAGAKSAVNAGATNASSASAKNAQMTQGVNINVSYAVERNKKLGYSRDLWKNIQEKVGLTGKDVDGYVGPTTSKAIAQKQAALGFTGKDIDGICGPKTLSALGLSKNGKQSGSSSSDSGSAKSDSNANSSGSGSAKVSVDINAVKSWYANQDYTKDTIKAIQKAVGFTDSKDIDGVIGKNTINKVVDWQISKNLTPDGKFGSSSASVAGITLAKNPAGSGKTGSGGSSSGNASIDAKQKELFGRALNRTGDTESWCRSFVTGHTVKMHDENGNEVTQKITVHKKLTDKFTAIFNEIYNEYPSFKFLKVSYGSYRVGSYNYRKVGGSTKLSYHSYGVAVDINEEKNPMLKKSSKGDGYSDSDIRIRSNSHKVVQIFAKYGFGWGGSYNDYMHFSYFNGY